MSLNLAIGVDVGGSTVKFGVVDENGHVIERDVRPTGAENGPIGVLRTVSEGINNLLEKYQESVGIGIGFPGMVNKEKQVCWPPNFPGWEVVDPTEHLSSLLIKPLPLTIENDANVAGWAEATIGSARGEPHFLYVTLGTGVGGCIISDGKIFRGATGGAGEIGHMTVDVNGPICNCGARGCVEAYVGSKYMTMYARQKMRRYQESLLHKLMNEGKELTPSLINEAAEGGDIFAQNFLTELGRILGAALAGVMNACDLHLCIVGGGISQAETFLLGQARRTLRARVLQPIASDVQLRVAALSTSVGVVGAGLLAISNAK
ncbi:MAG: ROK family protein [Chlorobi bacterium]|nr:ROK family protein [Chlorobiota bacterium]